MGRIPVAVDNSVLSDLRGFSINPSSFPPNKRDDLEAFDDIIKLDNQGILEIGISLSATLIEVQQAGGYKRDLVRKKMGSAWRIWPMAVSSQTAREMDQKSKCLQRIMQDKDGIDSKNLIVSTIYTRYYLTTDYKYTRQFRAQANRIKNLCKIDLDVLSPSEFLKAYNKQVIS